MKRFFVIMSVIAMLFAFTGCSESGKKTSEYDVDLTRLSNTMVYAEVYNMMVSPNDYIGKSVKMTGSFAVYQNPDTYQLYYACIIADATACCSQGIEFVLDGNFVFPDDYPEIGDTITVSGVFETYFEDGDMYCHLTGAELM